MRVASDVVRAVTEDVDARAAEIVTMLQELCYSQFLGIRGRLARYGYTAEFAERGDPDSDFCARGDLRQCATALHDKRREPDETIMRIVAGWPRNFDPRRAHELGFRAEANFDEIVRVYIDDELGHPLT